MNYYIQGDHARADKIKAAFEKLGCNTTGWKFNVEGGFYYTNEGKIDMACSKFLINLIMTHPDYKELELELAVKPTKFKAGDWLWHKEKGAFPVLIAGYDEERGYLAKYIGSESYFGRDATENEYRLWTINDAKDGDVLVCYSEAKGSPIEQAGIFFGKYAGRSNGFLAHTGIDWDGNIIINGYMSGTDIRPATKEQRDLLFSKMKEAGYTWDSETKELNKIQTHYDISNFKPKQWVLVRQGGGCAWRLDIFSHLKEGAVCRQFECVGNSMVQCIPFDGNANLLGTTDPCDEFYINW